MQNILDGILYVMILEDSKPTITEEVASDEITRLSGEILQHHREIANVLISVSDEIYKFGGDRHRFSLYVYPEEVTADEIRANGGWAKDRDTELTIDLERFETNIFEGRQLKITIDLHSADRRLVSLEVFYTNHGAARTFSQLEADLPGNFQQMTNFDPQIRSEISLGGPTKKPRETVVPFGVDPSDLVPAYTETNNILNTLTGKCQSIKAGKYIISVIGYQTESNSKRITSEHVGVIIGQKQLIQVPS